MPILEVAINSSKAKTGADQFVHAVESMKASVKDFLELIGLGLGIREFVKTVSEYEVAITKLGLKTKTSGDELEKMSEKIIRMGTQSPVAAIGLAKLAAQIAGIGVKGSESILELTKTFVEFEVVTGLAADSTIPILRQLTMQTGQSADEVGKLANVLTALGSGSSNNKQEILSLAVEIGGLGDKFHMTSEEVLALSSSLSSVGAGGRVAMALTQTMEAIDRAIKAGGQEAALLERITGQSNATSAGMAKASGTELFIRFAEGLKRMSEEGINTTAVMDRLGVKSDIVAGTILKAGKNVDYFKDQLKVAHAQMEDQTAIEDRAAKMAQTLEERYHKLTSTFQSAMLQARQSTGIMSDLTDTLAEAIRLLTGLTDSTEEASGGAIFLARSLEAVGIAAGFIAASKLLPWVYSSIAGFVSFTTTLTLFGTSLATVLGYMALFAATAAVAFDIGDFLSQWSVANDIMDVFFKHMMVGWNYVKLAFNQTVDFMKYGWNLLIEKIKSSWIEALMLVGDGLAKIEAAFDFVGLSVGVGSEGLKKWAMGFKDVQTAEDQWAKDSQANVQNFIDGSRDIENVMKEMAAQNKKLANESLLDVTLKNLAKAKDAIKGFWDFDKPKGMFDGMDPQMMDYLIDEMNRAAEAAKGLFDEFSDADITYFQDWMKGATKSLEDFDSKAQEARNSIYDLFIQSRQELGMIGMTNDQKEKNRILIDLETRARDAQITDMDVFIEQMEKEIGLYQKRTENVEKLDAALGKEIDKLLQARRLEAMAYDIGAAFGRTFEDMVIDAKSASEAMIALGKDIERAILRKLVTDQIVNAVGSGLTGLFGLAGGLFNSNPGVTQPAQGPMAFSAMGNVFGPGGITPFARGGVVSSPTMFGFSGGTGLMGEAGPEAVMPLKRGPDGTLGIKASGNVNVIIHNNSGQPATAQERDNGSGGKDIHVLIGEAAARDVRGGGALSQAIQQKFGLRNPGVNRG